MLELETYYRLEFSCGGVVYYAEEKFRDRYNCLWENIPATQDEFLFLDSWLEDLEVPWEDRDIFLELVERLDVTPKYRNLIRLFLGVHPCKEI